MILALPLLLAGPSHAEQAAEKSSHKRLMRHVGSCDADAFLADSLLGRRLATLMGDEFEHLRQNLDVRGEAGFNSSDSGR